MSVKEIAILDSKAVALLRTVVGSNVELEEVSVNPATTQVIETPEEGKAFSKVTVAAVTSAIDENIAAGNIKSGVTILGVEGTYTGE